VTHLGIDASMRRLFRDAARAKTAIMIMALLIEIFGAFLVVFARLLK
jgi:hypothetical protein